MFAIRKLSLLASPAMIEAHPMNAQRIENIPAPELNHLLTDLAATIDVVHRLLSAYRGTIVALESFAHAQAILAPDPGPLLSTYETTVATAKAAVNSEYQSGDAGNDFARALDRTRTLFMRELQARVGDASQP